MTKVNTTLMVAVCACTAIPSPVLGSYMTYNGLGLNSQVRIHASGLLGDTLKIPVGQLKGTYENTDSLAYCVDLNHHVKSANVTPEPISFVNHGDLVAWLYETCAESVMTGIEAAALNVAIWEVIYETDATFDAGTGYFTISENQSVLDQANDLLASLGSIPSSYTPSNGMMVLHGENVQDVVVPEPTRLGLPGVAAGGFLAKRRRRNR
jgi:hypothetical protein